MVKVNNQDIEWEDIPEGFYLTDVKEHVLWTDEKTARARHYTINNAIEMK